jgi:hypothetical protein
VAGFSLPLGLVEDFHARSATVPAASIWHGVDVRYIARQAWRYRGRRQKRQPAKRLGFPGSARE